MNSAILLRSGKPSQPLVEVAVRQTTFLWNQLVGEEVQVGLGHPVWGLVSGSPYREEGGAAGVGGAGVGGNGGKKGANGKKLPSWKLTLTSEYNTGHCSSSYLPSCLSCSLNILIQWLSYLSNGYECSSQPRTPFRTRLCTGVVCFSAKTAELLESYVSQRARTSYCVIGVYRCRA